MRRKNIYHIAIALITLAAFLCQAAAVGEKEVLFQQFSEFFNADIGAFKDCAQGPGFYGFGAMQWNNSPAAQVIRMGQCNMAIFLTAEYKTRFFKRPDYALTGDLRKGWNIQTDTSISSNKTSDSGTGSLSSLNDSRYNSMASFALARHSSNVSPCVAHPGRAGTETEYPPPDSFSSIILNLRNILSNLLDYSKYILFTDDSQAKCGEGYCLRPLADEEAFSSRLRPRAVIEKSDGLRGAGEGESRLAPRRSDYGRSAPRRAAVEHTPGSEGRPRAFGEGRPRVVEYRRGTLKITNVGQMEGSILQMERENSYNLFDRMMRLMMAAPIHYTARNDSKEHQKTKYNVKKINSFHFYSSPLSIDSPTTNNVKNETIPVITRLNLNPEIKGPTINVATQILLISKSVLPKFSRWRFVNFIKHKYISLNTFCQDYET